VYRKNSTGFTTGLVATVSGSATTYKIQHPDTLFHGSIMEIFQAKIYFNGCTSISSIRPVDTIRSVRWNDVTGGTIGVVDSSACGGQYFNVPLRTSGTVIDSIHDKRDSIKYAFLVNNATGSHDTTLSNFTSNILWHIDSAQYGKFINLTLYTYLGGCGSLFSSPVATYSSDSVQVGFLPHAKTVTTNYSTILVANPLQAVNVLYEVIDTVSNSIISDSIPLSNATLGFGGLIPGHVYWVKAVGVNLGSTDSCTRLLATIHLTGYALPVKLVSFEAHVCGSSNCLEWTTVSEIDNRLFEIERSTDGEIFYTIDSVLGAGNSTVAINYLCVDMTAEFSDTEVMYYRLRQVDVDGKYTYSPIVSVSRQNSQTLIVYPNPVSSTLHIVSSSAFYGNISIYNTLGSLVRVLDLATSATSIDVLSLPSGLYIIKTGERYVHFSKL
jgi:hypothetical protein